MAKPSYVLGILLFTIAMIILILFFSQRKEGFGPYDDYVNDRNLYILQGKQRYNNLSVAQDVTRGNFIGSDNPADIYALNNNIKNALVSSELNTSSSANTRLEIFPAVSRTTIAPRNQLFKDVKKCEEFKTRDSCANLDNPEYANCGVCIKGGSSFSYDNPNGHIGGLFLHKDDKLKAETEVSGTNLRPTYQPSVGECPGDYFFANRAECEKQVNRLDCEELGQSGGFNNGKTIEGKNVIDKCAQVTMNENPTFIYEPKNRSFSVNLRAQTPKGSGTCRIYVYNSNKQQVGYKENLDPGKEFIVEIKNVKENDELIVLVLQESPYVYGGTPELYQVKSANKVTLDDSKSVCKRYGSVQGTKEQLDYAQQTGAQACNPAWTSDGFLGWPTRDSSSNCGSSGVNGRMLGNSSNELGDTWCYGLKPPAKSNKVLSGFPVVEIMPWYTQYRNFQPTSTSSVSVSANSVTYQNTYERAVLLQWEVASGQSVRSFPFDKTIRKIDNYNPEGYQLRKFGTYANSSLIREPRWLNGTSKISSTLPWIWSKIRDNQTVEFIVRVPGIFLDSYYTEDRAESSRGPLISNKELLGMLLPSPCESGKPGEYSLDCLKKTFLSAGGDINKGTLVTENGGLMAQLNPLGPLSKIEEYLANLYAIATTGKDINGLPTGATSKQRSAMINDAALKLFGFEIATSCEDIKQDFEGNIVIVPKSSDNIDADCLDYLWRNTGTESENGVNDASRKIKNTYTSIGKRFSGLRSFEGSAATVQSNPFTLCQRTGSVAPIKPNGEINEEAVAKAKSLGGIADIQRYYDSIYRTANDSSNDPTAQENAVKQCYGLTKAKPAGPISLGCWGDNGHLIPGYIGDLRKPTPLERRDECIGIAKAYRNKLIAEKQVPANWKPWNMIGIRWGQCSVGYTTDNYKRFGPGNVVPNRWGQFCDQVGNTSEVYDISFMN
jgi:hypothetical protein